MTPRLPSRSIKIKACLMGLVPFLTAIEIYLRLNLSAENQRLFAVLGLLLYACLFGALLWRPLRWWAFVWCVGVMLPLTLMSRFAV